MEHTASVSKMCPNESSVGLLCIENVTRCIFYFNVVAKIVLQTIHDCKNG